MSFAEKCRASKASTTRRPFGTYLAEPSAFVSTWVDQSVPINLAYCCGRAASNICRQVLR